MNNCLTGVLRIGGCCAAARGSLWSAAGAEHDRREYPAYLHPKGTVTERRLFSFFAVVLPGDMRIL